MRVRAAALPIVLSACVGAAPAPEDRPSRLVLGADGFLVSGTRLEIGFGRAERGAISASTRLIGAGPLRRAGCTVPGRSILTWANGVSMIFQDGAFVGWQSDNSRIPLAGDLARGPDGSAARGLQCGAAT